jgi:hypothetical protein
MRKARRWCHIAADSADFLNRRGPKLMVREKLSAFSEARSITALSGKPFCAEREARSNGCIDSGRGSVRCLVAASDESRVGKCPCGERSSDNSNGDPIRLHQVIDPHSNPSFSTGSVCLENTNSKYGSHNQLAARSPDTSLEHRLLARINVCDYSELNLGLSVVLRAATDRYA